MFSETKGSNEICNKIDPDVLLPNCINSELLSELGYNKYIHHHKESNLSFPPHILVSDCLFSGFRRANRIFLVKQGVILFYNTIFMFTLPELLSADLDKAQLLRPYTYVCVKHNFIRSINSKCGFHAITNAYLFNLVIVFSLDLWTHLKTNIIKNIYCQ